MSWTSMPTVASVVARIPAVSPLALGGVRSTPALGVEVSQLRYALGARSARSPAAGDGELRTRLRRRDALLRELRRRGLDVPEERMEPHPPQPPHPCDLPQPCDPSVVVASVVGQRPRPDRGAPVDLAVQVGQLAVGMAARTVIGQAQGMLVERHTVTADGAFQMLVRASHDTNRQLRDIAADLVRTGDLAGRG